MTPHTEGAVPQPELAPQAPPTEPQLPPQQAAEPAASPAAEPAAKQDIAALQAQLAEMQQARQTAEQQARDHQAAFTRSQQQLRAMMGVQPEQDPLAPYVERFKTQHGLDADSAKIMASVQYENDQKYARLQSAVVAQTQLPSAINQVCSENPALASVHAQLYTAIQQDVAQGNVNALNPEYIRTIGARLYLDTIMQPNGRPAQPQVAPPVPQFSTQFGPSGGMNPPQQAPTQNQLPPGVKAWQDAEKATVNQRFGINPQTAS